MCGNNGNKMNPTEPSAELRKRDVLLVFVKYPEPGRVKTRLAAAVGPERAARLYKSLAERVVRSVCQGPESYCVVLCYDPPGQRDAFTAWLGRSMVMVAQRPGDLGERLVGAFEWAFSQGANKVAAIGSDCPDADHQVALAAFSALDRSDLVIGPSEDGGYYLIGLRSPCPAIFDGIPWSSTKVLNTTFAVADQLGLTFHLLSVLPDIDTVEDLQRHFGSVSNLTFIYDS